MDAEKLIPHLVRLCERLKIVEARVTVLAWLVFLMLALVSVLMLTGCQRLELTLSDGSHMVHTQCMTDQHIGSVSYDDGSFTMDGYQSEMQKALEIISRLTPVMP